MSSKVVAIIPARQGSKRLPGKNKKLFCGKPLFAWTVEQALACDFIDKIIVSTDDWDIMDYCHETYRDLRISIGHRPESLSQDDTKINSVVLYELLGYPHDTTVILLQPTSPLREVKDIILSYKKLYLKLRGSVPIVGCYFDLENKLFKLNGSIFIAQKYYFNNAIFNHPIIYTMPKERSVDIDTLEDFEEAERLMKKRLGLE